MKKKKSLKKGILILKVNSEERTAILACARKYTGGNVSRWLRLSGRLFRPKASDLFWKGLK